MYKNSRQGLLVVGLVLVSILSAFSQATNSPFTSRGIGDINNLSLAHNQGMGGLGLSNGNYWNLNNMNPALLPYNTLTVFTAGLLMERRNISNDQTTETHTGGTLNYLATAFPIVPGKWTSSLGLAPYSNVDYKYTTFDVPVVGNDTTFASVTEEGSGGFSQLYWSNGVAITRNFSVGLKATYLFSNIETLYSDELQQTDDLVVFMPGVKSRTSVSDFMFQGSLAYRKDSIFNNRVQLNFGATYDLGTDVSAELLESTELLLNDQPVVSDTLSLREDGRITLPWALGAGFSFNNGIKWTAGIDFKYQPWSEFKNFQGSNEDLADAYSIVLGGEYTPDPSSVESYLKRVTYRMGFSYENTPYVISGKQVNEFGINFGWSLPVSRFSSLDMAFKYGQRGNISDTIVEEQFYRFSFGFTFNDQWFIKRKYD